MWIAICLSMAQVAAQNPAPAEVPYRDLFGVCIDDAGDLDGDGVHDLWIGDPSMLTDSSETDGCAWAVSGKTGKKLRCIKTPPPALGFGWTLTALDDLDGDGKRDVAVGCEFTPSKNAPQQSFEICHTSPAGESTVFVYSGATGEMRFSVVGPADTLKFAWHTTGAGPSLASVGDWNGDGAGDLAIGWSFADGEVRDCGRVDVVSGKDDSVLHSWTGSEAHGRLGYALTALGDLDGDGRRELAATALPDYEYEARAEHPDLGRIRSGRVHVLSSTGSVLFTLAPTDDVTTFGMSTASLADVDRDGVSDIAVGQPFSSCTAITVWSGRTGKLVRRLEPPDRDVWDGGWMRDNVGFIDESIDRSFGLRLVGGPDRDGDGLDDLFATTAMFVCHVPAGIVSSVGGEALGHVALPDGLEGNWSHVGVAAARLGDLDGDEIGDLAVGGASIRYDGEGIVALVSAGSLSPLWIVQRCDMRD